MRLENRLKKIEQSRSRPSQEEIDRACKDIAEMMRFNYSVIDKNGVTHEIEKPFFSDERKKEIYEIMQSAKKHR